jgi:ATP-binding cassette subfamily F protein 3
VVYNPKALKGVFEQTNIRSLVETRTVEEEISYSASGMDKQSCPQYLRLHDVRG